MISHYLFARFRISPHSSTHNSYPIYLLSPAASVFIPGYRLAQGLEFVFLSLDTAGLWKAEKDM